MNSNNNIRALGRRIVLLALVLVSTVNLSSAYTNDAEEKLSEKEAKELILEIREDFALPENYQMEFIVDDEGNILPAPIEIIKIYDKNNELLLEAPIFKLNQSKNPHLRRLINASDFLTQYSHTKYYRLDI